MVRRIHRQDGLVEWRSDSGGSICVREIIHFGKVVGVVTEMPWGAGEFGELLWRALAWKDIVGLEKLLVETTEMDQIHALKAYGFSLKTESVLSSLGVVPPHVAPVAAAMHSSLPAMPMPPEEDEEDEEEEDIDYTPEPPPSPAAARKAAIAETIRKNASYGVDSHLPSEPVEEMRPARKRVPVEVRKPGTIVRTVSRTERLPQVADHQGERGEYQSEPRQERMQQGILPFAQNPRVQSGPVLGGVE